MAIRIDASRALLIQATRMIDRGVGGLEVTCPVAEAKLFAAETAWQVANDALQILGGIGYTKKYPVERYLRDVRVVLICHGTTEVMREIIQRQVFRELAKVKTG